MSATVLCVASVGWIARIGSVDGAAFRQTQMLHLYPSWWTEVPIRKADATLPDISGRLYGVAIQDSNNPTRRLVWVAGAGGLIGYTPDLHVYGSANLVQTLLKHDLVDAFWLKIFPITLGGGKRLFADGTIPAAFKVMESTVTSTGVIIVNYERAGAVPTGSL